MIVLPFKPFTLSEVRDITGVSAKVLENLVDTEYMPTHLGDDQFTRGLNDTQLFAVFCMQRFLDEGANPEIAGAVLECVCGLGLQRCKELEKHRPPQMAGWHYDESGVIHGIVIDAPLSRMLGRKLNFAQLVSEFERKLAQVFPTRPQVQV